MVSSPTEVHDQAVAAPLNHRRPEILAPAGNATMMRAAIENGADAIYFGVQAFNARLRADNFQAADLPSIMRELHERGVKGYLTVNTLVFAEELAEAAVLLQRCADAGVDAIIVQDLGLAWLASQIVPELPVHASTQMTVTCAESIAGLEALGIHPERVVVARELSRRDLAQITKHTSKELEVFVHGALCVAYSGQCLTSEALGGRSANRGECAQACRLPYDLIVDGEKRELEGLKYLLSPMDLAAYDDVPDLWRIGISSLKIEGRLKSPEYVAATVQAYKGVLDKLESNEPNGPLLDTRALRKLETTFSRGFTKGYLHSVDHQKVVEGRSSTKRGTLLGTVVGTSHNGITIELISEIKPGDGLVFDSGRPPEEEEGGRVYEIFKNAKPLARAEWVPGEPPLRVRLAFGTGQVDHSRIGIGDRVWKTSDPELLNELKRSYTVDLPRHVSPIDIDVFGELNAPLKIVLRDSDGIEAAVCDTLPTELAHARPLAAPVLEKHLGRLGGTPFRLGTLTLHLQGDLMVPFSRLNELRRQGVEALIEKRRERGTKRTRGTRTFPELRAAGHPQIATAVPTEAELSVLCRTIEQVEAALECGARTIYTDFEDIRLHKTARTIIPRDTVRFFPATLRVVKPGEIATTRRLLQSEPDGVLVRNLASWQLLIGEAPGLPLIGDYSLNVANDLTAKLLMAEQFAYLTPSYDLNFDQLKSMLQHVPAGWFEVTLQQYMPMFHMEHCVFCRFLSDGTDSSNCGRPCESHEVRIRDRVGHEHPIKADFGCRNTVFNAVPQSGAAYLTQLLALGVKRYRLDLLLEDRSRTVEAITLYQQALRGEHPADDLWRKLNATSKLGVTKGSLDHTGEAELRAAGLPGDRLYSIASRGR